MPNGLMLYISLKNSRQFFNVTKNRIYEGFFNVTKSRMYEGFFNVTKNRMYEGFFNVTKNRMYEGFFNVTKNRMYEGFFDYKTFGNNTIPQEYRIDILWHHLAHMRRQDGIGDNFRFHLLFNVARLVLITLHSNASIERVYALVKKLIQVIETEGALSSILAVKLERLEERCKCDDYKPEMFTEKKLQLSTTIFMVLKNIESFFLQFCSRPLF